MSAEMIHLLTWLFTLVAAVAALGPLLLALFLDRQAGSRDWQTPAG